MIVVTQAQVVIRVISSGDTDRVMVGSPSGVFLP
jgi:hypothetical protein